MEKRVLGTSGPSVSVIGLGCNNFGMRIDAEASRAVVDAALDAGINHFDTAEMYGQGKSEEFLGRALGSRRDEAVIATKFTRRQPGDEYAPGKLRSRILEACEASLRRLGTDRIDVYYEHHPDPEAPVSELLDTLGELVDAGKVLHVACSNIDAPGLAERVAQAGSARVRGNQIHWNMLERGVEDSVVPAAREHGVGIVPYFPLASGLLTGKYHAGEPFPPGSRLDSSPYFAKIATPENLAKVGELTAFAEKHGHTVGELAIAWLAAQPGVASVIAGATTPAQIEANVAAGTWTLTPEQLADVPL